MNTRIAAGEYRTIEGYRVTRSWKDGGTRGDEWHLFDPSDNYCQTYGTKREAVAAATRIQAIADRFEVK